MNIIGLSRIPLTRTEKNELQIMMKIVQSMSGKSQDEIITELVHSFRSRQSRTGISDERINRIEKDARPYLNENEQVLLDRFLIQLQSIE